MPAYTFDAENHLISTGGISYAYDGDGQRLWKAPSSAPTQPTKIYWYGADGNVLVETNGSGATLFRHYYFNGRRVARYEITGGPGNYWIDHYGLDALGNTRFLYDYQSWSQGKNDYIDYYPFGAERDYTDVSSNTYKFTGKERDSESGLDNFGARYDSSSMGRFMSPDPGNISAILNQDDPQSWNAYAYVRNNPVNLTDEDGQNYDVCDVNGKNCADLTDEQYAQFRQDNPNLRVTPSGDIYTINENGTETKTGSASYYNEHALDDLINAGNMAAPGVNFAANGLRMFGYAVAAPLMVAAECGAGAESCTKGNVAMAILPEVAALREGGIVLKEAAAAGKGAEKIRKLGGAVQAAKDFEGLQGAEKVYGTTRVKTLSDGTKAVLYNSTSEGVTIAIQEGGRTVTKFRY